MISLALPAALGVPGQGPFAGFGDAHGDDGASPGRFAPSGIGIEMEVAEALAA